MSQVRADTDYPKGGGVTPEDKAYEQGYENGESSQLADWVFALTEYGGFNDVEGPMQVAREIAELRRRLAECEARKGAT